MNQKEFVNSGKYLLNEVKIRAEEAHSHFFDADTMRFFSSRVSELCWNKGMDIYFITSEADKSSFKHSGSIRAFTIRKCSIDGNIDTIGKFQEYSTLNEARKGIKEILESKEIEA